MNINHNSTPQTDDEIRAELEDRLMDLNLEDLLGSSRIPATAHIAAPTESEPVSSATKTSGASLRRRRFFQVMGVICPLLILGVLWYFTPPNSSSYNTVSGTLAPVESPSFDESMEAVGRAGGSSQQSDHYARDDAKYDPASTTSDTPILTESDYDYIGSSDSGLDSEESARIHRVGQKLDSLKQSSGQQSGAKAGKGTQPATSSKVYPVGDLVGNSEPFLLELPRPESSKSRLQKYERGGELDYKSSSNRRPAVNGTKKGDVGGIVSGGRRNRPVETTPGNSPETQDRSRLLPQLQSELSKEKQKNTDLQVEVDRFEIEDPAEGRGPGESGDNYAPIVENPFQIVTDTPLSTFSIDVDTASYSNLRRILSQNRMLPPPDAVRIEEMVNYFNYAYPAPVGDDPFSVHVDQGQCPWQPKHRLVRIGLKGKEIPVDERPASNLVFLLDVSGSMKDNNKLPLLKDCLKMMVDYLTENDSVAIVVYAQASGMVLPPTNGDNKAVIMGALDSLNAGGSTNGGEGIQLAYKTAVENYIQGGINRVILATDGDFNVGTTGLGDLQRLIEEKAKSGVFLTTLGFGFGNLKDNTIELLANKGNGNYAYIDSLREGRKVLIDEMGSTLVTIAKDVKIQIDFNPLEVAAYRLLGYENRLLDERDFRDDTVDAGEIGAGHTVTALYELIPAGDQPLKPEVDQSEYVKPARPSKAAKSGNLMTVKLRYKLPDEDSSTELQMRVPDMSDKLTEPSLDFMFASQVASFGMLLRGSKYSGVATYDSVLEIAQSSLGENPESYRTEFIDLVKLAKQYDRRVRPGRGKSGGY